MGKWRNIIFAMLFVETGCINLTLSIICKIVGCENSYVIDIIKYSFYIIVFFLLFIIYIKNVIDSKPNKKDIAVLVIIPVLLLTPELYNCFVSSFDMNSALNICKYGVFVIPYYFLSVVIAYKKKLDMEFVKVFKWIGLLFTPFFVFYIINLIIHSEESYNFMLMTYMDLAYFAVPIFIGSLMDYLFHMQDKTEKRICFLEILITLYFIICTGTRGAILVVIASNVLCFLYTVLIRKDIAKKTSIILFITFALVAFSFCVWQPEGNRLSEGGFLFETGEKHDFANEINTEDGTLESTSRVVLYKAAIEEFKKRPFLGGGFYYFVNKYGVYPHNAILELLCDSGIVGTTFFVTVIIGILVKLWRRMKIKEVATVLLMTLPYTVSYMVSGCVYMQTMIAFYVSIGLFLSFNKGNEGRE